MGDVSYQYLRHIMEDDERLSQIGAEYAAGRLLSGEVKQICIDELTALVAEHQANMAQVTDEVVKHFMDPKRGSFKMFSLRIHIWFRLRWWSQRACRMCNLACQFKRYTSSRKSFALVPHAIYFHYVQMQWK